MHTARAGAVVFAFGGVLEPETAVAAADFARYGVYDVTGLQLSFKCAFAERIVAGVG